MIKRMCFGLVFLGHLVSILASAESNVSNCVEEFGTCVMNRDCCNSLECVAGDWAVTTDSTCLSRRSQFLNNLSDAEKVEGIAAYYVSLPQSDGARKSQAQVEKIIAKYEQKFAQLVTRLEKKYGVPFRDESSSGTAQEL